MATNDPNEIERVAGDAILFLHAAMAQVLPESMKRQAAWWRELPRQPWARHLRAGADLARVAAPYDALPGEPARAAWDNYQSSAVAAVAWLCAWWLEIGERHVDDVDLVDVGIRLRTDIETHNTLGYLKARVHKEVGQVLVATGVTRRPRERKGSLDFRACALLDAWSESRSSAYRGTWTHADVARELGVKPAALTGRQRDKTMRCPEYMRRMAGMVDARRRPRPDRSHNGRRST